MRKRINFTGLVSEILTETDDVDSNELFGLISQMQSEGYDDETIKETLQTLLRKLKSL